MGFEGGISFKKSLILDNSSLGRFWRWEITKFFVWGLLSLWSLFPFIFGILEKVFTLIPCCFECWLTDEVAYWSAFTDTEDSKLRFFLKWLCSLDVGRCLLILNMSPLYRRISISLFLKYYAVALRFSSSICLEIMSRIFLCKNVL